LRFFVDQVFVYKVINSQAFYMIRFANRLVIPECLSGKMSLVWLA